MENILEDNVYFYLTLKRGTTRKFQGESEGCPD